MPLTVTLAQADEAFETAATHHRAGRLDDAVTGYQRVVRAKPDHADAYSNLGFALQTLGRSKEAETSYRRAIAVKADHAEALNNLGITLQSLGRATEAETSHRRAIALAPGYAEAYSNLGITLQSLGRAAEAETSYRRAIALSPGFPEAHSNLGFALHAIGRLGEAEASYHHALAINPNYAEAYNNLGKLLFELFRVEESETAHGRAIAINPNSASAHTNLGVVLKTLRRLDQSEASHSRAHAIDPGFPDARQNRALTRFAQGRPKAAWADFEARWTMAGQYCKRPFSQPWWRGDALDGRKILIWGEQGLGDEILGASMLPDLIARGGTVLVECDGRLTDLFARSFPGVAVIARQTPPQSLAEQADVQSPIFGLGQHVRAELADFPRRHGYLTADPAKRQHWRNWLDSLGPGRKVGISWRGRMVHIDRSDHYVVLERLAEILSIPGLVFVNLQYDGHTQEIEALRDNTGHIIHCPPDLDLTHDIDGAAALTAELDAVVGPATAVGILAGALGRPTWMYAVFPASNEKEILGLDHIPWCPSIQVEKHGYGDEWSETLGRIAHTLRSWADR